jgi:putative transcriptional regulator
MAIKLKLSERMAERGISLTELSKRVGVTMANLSILKTNKGRAIRFSTLDALCRELDCQPGDLLAYGDGTALAEPPVPPVPAEKQNARQDRRSESGLPGDYY